MFRTQLANTRENTMPLTEEQKRRRHEDEQRRLRNERNLQQGSMAYYVNQSDTMVEVFSPPPAPSSCGTDSGSSSDSGGSCD